MQIRLSHTDPDIIYYLLPSNHYLISMQEITLNLSLGSVLLLLLRNGKLLSSVPVVVNTAILRWTFTNASAMIWASSLKTWSATQPWVNLAWQLRQHSASSAAQRKKKQCVNGKSSKMRICPSLAVWASGDESDAKDIRPAQLRWELGCQCLLRGWLIAWSAVH